jgi:hypothetical protein
MKSNSSFAILAAIMAAAHLGGSASAQLRNIAAVSEHIMMMLPTPVVAAAPAGKSADSKFVDALLNEIQTKERKMKHKPKVTNKTSTSKKGNNYGDLSHSYSYKTSSSKNKSSKRKNSKSKKSKGKGKGEKKKAKKEKIRGRRLADATADVVQDGRNRFLDLSKSKQSKSWNSKSSSKVTKSKASKSKQRNSKRSNAKSSSTLSKSKASKSKQSKSSNAKSSSKVSTTKASTSKRSEQNDTVVCKIANSDDGYYYQRMANAMLTGVDDIASVAEDADVFFETHVAAVSTPDVVWDIDAGSRKFQLEGIDNVKPLWVNSFASREFAFHQWSHWEICTSAGGTAEAAFRYHGVVREDGGPYQDIFGVIVVHFDRDDLIEYVFVQRLKTINRPY